MNPILRDDSKMPRGFEAGRIAARALVEVAFPCYPSLVKFLCLFALLIPTALGEDLKTFENCALEPTEWADGDSFQVRLPDGRKQTVRLYGADCIEMHVQGDDSNARRLRDQRRYFGIADITLAKSVGEAAKAETAKLLEKPFTVQTAFADGRGDGRFSRVYAFVRTHEGKDLSATLVSMGLARAFGVTRQRADGTAGTEWMQELKDLELTAARAGRGAWAHTNWDKLPEFRKEAREEQTEIEEAKGVATASENKPIDLNLAARDELMALPGVGEKTANRIIGARPFKSVEDLTKVPSLSKAAIEKLRPFVVVTTP